MTTALVRVFGDRPPWVKKDGVWICVSLHDAAHLADVAAWQRRLRALFTGPHAAMRATETVTRRLRAYRRWQHSERVFYASLALSAPRAQWTARSARRRAKRHITWGAKIVATKRARYGYSMQRQKKESPCFVAA